MTNAFKTLRDVSCDFENDLRRGTTELFAAKSCQSFEDVIAKKIQDLSLFSSKLRLLQANTLSCTPQITEINKSEDTTLSNLGDAATWKVIEQQVVKCVTQSDAVKDILCAPNNELEPELLERKQKIIETLQKYAQQESILRSLEATLCEKETELVEARRKWDETVSSMREGKNVGHDTERAAGPLYKKLKMLVDKMQLMQWLITKLVTSRTEDYDWASDPHTRLRALALARRKYSIEDYS